MTSKTCLLSMSALLTALLGACSSTPVAPPAAPATPTAATTAPPARASTTAPPATPAPAPASNVATVSLPAYLDAKSDIYNKRSVFFGFDEYTVSPQYTGVIESHGKYLSANPSLHVRIEGNTDERGSSEYNLALGQKRAEAVRQALKVFGVRDTQMEAVSWGKERPKAAGHDEAAWAQNRRADVQYPAK